MELIGTGIQRAGKESRVGVGATFLSFASFDADMSAPDLSTVNFESFDASAFTDGESFDEGLHGAMSCAISFGGDWDAGTNPLDDPPGLYVRDDLADLVFTVNRGDATTWDFPYARLRSSKNASTVEGLVTFECSGMNQGTFTPPTGSV